MKALLDKIREKELNLPILAIFLFVVVAFGFLLLGTDMQMIIRWQLVNCAFGLCVLPLNCVLFKGFGRMGYIFSRILGLAIVSYIVWLLSNFKILAFGRASIIFIVILCTILSIICLAYKYKKKTNIDEREGGIECLTAYSLETIISFEIVVLLVFILVTWLLGTKIPGNQTERLMDIAFMVTIDKTEFMGPLDMWAAGNNINYYYFGHYMMTLLSKAAFVDVKFGYSMALSMIMTICIICCFVFIYKFLKRIISSNSYSIAGGIIAALAVCFAGNGHYIVFYKIVPMLRDILGISGEHESYWFADSTRYIGYIPENVTDRTISEFPFYSFILGDLHAHVIDLLLVILLLAIAISYSFSNIERLKKLKTLSDEQDIITMKVLDLLNSNIIILGFLLAIASMTNYWDYLIYFVVCGAVVLLCNLYCYGISLRTVGLTILQGGFVWIISNIINYPFMSRFDKMINGIGIVQTRSYFHQLLIMWGLPVTVVILMIIFVSSRYMNSKGGENRIEFTDALVIILALCAVGLVFVPEVVFVKDIYIDGAPRANTMFKLTYQAFILFGLVMAYSFVRLFAVYHSERKSGNLLHASNYRMLMVCFIIWLFTLGYPVTAVRMWMGEFNTLEYKGLDSSVTIIDISQEEKTAIGWIESELKGREVILTASGSSYSDTCIISGLTGHPTILGWITHEWLWHNGYDFVDKRQKDIDEIYMGSNLQTKYELCEKYNVDYIFIGKNEYDQYPELQLKIMQQLGDIVYYDNDYSAYIIKVKR